MVWKLQFGGNRAQGDSCAGKLFYLKDVENLVFRKISGDGI